MTFRQPRFSTNLQAKCSNDLCSNRVQIRPTAKRMGRKFKAMEEKYMYKFVYPARCFLHFPFPFLKPEKSKHTIRS